MLRLLVSLSLVGLLLWSCGPENPLDCSSADPAFQVIVKLESNPLPADLVMRVSYGGSGKETFRLSDQDADHEVTFCNLADQDGMPLDASTAKAGDAEGASGAGGASSEPQAVAALSCSLWTGGYTELEFSGSGFTQVKYDLVRKNNQCTVTRKLVLDLPDAGT